MAQKFQISSRFSTIRYHHKISKSHPCSSNQTHRRQLTNRNISSVTQHLISRAQVLVAAAQERPSEASRVCSTIAFYTVSNDTSCYVSVPVDILQYPVQRGLQCYASQSCREQSHANHTLPYHALPHHSIENCAKTYHYPNHSIFYSTIQNLH